MKRYIYILFVLVVFLSCKKNFLTQPKDGEVLILVNAEKIERQQTMSKAVSQDGFTEVSVIGLYSQTEVEGVNDLVTVKDEDFGYSFSGAMYLTPVDSRKVIYFQPMQKLSLYGYHPYSGSSDNVEMNTSGDRVVVFSLNPVQNTESDLTYNDLMYAKCTGVFQEAPIADLRFSHKLCKVTLKIISGSNWTKTPILTKVSMSGVHIPMQCRMRMFDGALQVLEPSDVQKTISWESGENTGIALNNQIQSRIEFLTLPYAAGGTLVEFMVSGEHYEYILPDIDFRSSTNVNYNVTLNYRSTGSIEVSMSIDDWEVMQVVDIKPN